MKKSISIWKAIRLLLKNSIETGTETLPLCESIKRFTTKNIYSNYDYPLFDQSAMDGYAVKYSVVKENKVLKVVGEIPAGKNPEKYNFSENIAVRVFTGAPIPPGADTVIMQEKTENINSAIKIKDNNVKKGQHIRRKGEIITKNQLILKKGTQITPNIIALLASLGIYKLKVKKLPSISFVITGNELITADNKYLSPGQIFESNSRMLCSAIKQDFNVNISNIHIIEDRKNSFINLLKGIESDIIIITGGVSVGKYDYTPKVLEELNYKIIFHKVLQKPGKPFLFARNGNKVVFGLPGNPRSVVICYYLYIYPYIRKVLGAENLFLPSILLRSLSAYNKKDDGRTHIRTVDIKGNNFNIDKNQQSHNLFSLRSSRGFVLINKNISVGELKKVYLFPL